MDTHEFRSKASEVFSDIKCLMSGDVMALPDMSLPFILSTNAGCKNGKGAVLS